MKKNNTFKLALLMALVAGEAFAATTQSRPQRKRPVPSRKMGRPPANRKKINPGVQSQKTNTTKQDVVNVVKQFMHHQATPKNLNILDTFLAKLSQDNLNALNTKGIKNEKDALGLVRKIEALAKKAPKNVNRQKINPGVQGQKTDTTKQDVMNVVKRFMSPKPTPQELDQLNQFSVRLGQLSQDDLNALKAKGIQNRDAAIAMVQEAKRRFKNKGTNKPGDLTDMEKADLLKKIQQMTKEHKDALDKVTKEKADLEKQLEAAKKSTASSSIGSGGSSDEITKLKKTIQEKDYEISGLEGKVKKIKGLEGLFADEKPLVGQEGALAAALTALVTDEGGDRGQLNKVNLDNLLGALKLVNLNSIPVFAALDAEKKVSTLNTLLDELKPGGVDNLDKIKEFEALKNDKNVDSLNALLTALDLGDVKSLKDIDEFKALNGEGNNTVATLNALLNALDLGGLANLDQIKEFAELKAAAEAAVNFDDQNVEKFATALEKVLGAGVLDGQPGAKLTDVLEYLKAAKTGDEARKVANLNKFLGGDIQVYGVSQDGNDLTKDGDKQKLTNGRGADPVEMLKGKTFILVDVDKIAGANADWEADN